MKYWWVNPAATSDIQGPYFDGQTHVTLPSGRTVERILTAVPEWGLYEAVIDTSSPPPYNTQTGVTTAFTGTVGGPSGRVVETNVYARISLDDLLSVKMDELLDYADTVFFSSLQMTAAGGTAYWISLRLTSRLYRASINGGLQFNGELLTRNIPVWLVRVSDGKEFRVKIDNDDWSGLAKDQGRFDVDVGYASDAKEVELEAAYDASDWDALAAIDVTVDPPGNPWPVHSTTAFR